MISANEIQKQYVALYKTIRNYIWPFRVVNCLADLEIAVYETFPDVADINVKFQRLNVELRETAKEDEAMNKALKDFDKVLKDADDIYAKLKQVNEVG